MLEHLGNSYEHIQNAFETLTPRLHSPNKQSVWKWAFSEDLYKEPEGKTALNKYLIKESVSFDRIYDQNENQYSRQHFSQDRK